MSLFALGLNHNTASLEKREKAYFSDNESKELLKEMLSLSFVEEAIILSTCNRTELYCELEDPEYMDELSKWVLDYKGLDKDSYEELFYKLSDDKAVKHALNVASGLDSMVLGEPQILGQLKIAYKNAQEVGALGKNLNRLFQYAFSAAKEIRTDTKIGLNPLSIAGVAVSLTDEFYKDLSNKNALLVGSGETIFIAAKKLAQKKIGNITICNRSKQSANEIAKNISAQVAHISEISKFLTQADIIISATASNLPVIGKGAIETAMSKRKHKPIYIVDLAVPRDVEPEVKRIPNIYLYTIDNIQDLVSENYETRVKAANDASSIIDLKVQDYMNWRKAQTAFSVIRMYRNYADQIKNESLKKALQQLRNGKDPEEIIKQLSSNITSKLTHNPTQALNKAGQSSDRKVIELICDIFLQDKN